MKLMARPVVVLLLLLAVLGVASAQGWKPYDFHQDERYEFRIVKYEQDGWEDDAWSIPRIVARESGYTVEIRRTDMENEYGEPIFEVKAITTTRLAQEDLGNQISGGMLGYNTYVDFTNVLNPFYFLFLADFFIETEWEVGERMSLLGLGRVSIVAEESMGGRSGFVLRLESGDAGSRTIAAEWIIDPELAMPIGARSYSDGEVRAELILDAYQRL